MSEQVLDNTNQLNDGVPFSEGMPPMSNEQEKPQQDVGVSAKQFQPIYIGGKRFDSSDQLAEYTSKLEANAQSYQMQQNYIQKTNEVADPDKDIADLMFEDPKTAIRLIKEQAKEEVINQIGAQKTQEQVWERFYAENSDLKGMEDLVDICRGRIQGKLSQLPLDVAMKELADNARSRIATIRQTPHGGKELPSGQAFVASSNGAPSQPVTVQAEIPSFVDQMRSLRKTKQNTIEKGGLNG